MTSAGAIIGRDSELGILTSLITKCPDGGRAIVVTGEPGIGKSSLLAASGETARSLGFRVLAATGVESEAQLPFAGLHQLLRRVLRQADQLTPLHRDALMAALGLAEGPQPDSLLIALAAERLLARLATDQPVVVLADDVQWLDEQSQDALAFLARRAAAHPVAVIAVMRTGHSGPFLTGGIEELVLGGVSDEAAELILAEHASGLTPAERHRIQAEARGNPLALVELPAAWTGPGQGPADWQEITLSSRLERAFASRLADLPAPARDAVLVAAVNPVTDLAEILAASAKLSGTSPTSVNTLDPAIEAGLLEVTGTQIHFRHPLVRSGVLQAETLTRRQSAHAALAASLTDDPYRRTWHRAQAIVGPDDEVADELEANVGLALARGAVLSAIADLQRAAQLTSSSTRRGHRLLKAAEQAFGLGRVDLVGQLVKEAAATDLSELDQARIQWLREIFNDGVPGDAARVAELCAAARRSASGGDVDLALNLLLGAAMRCWWADTGPAARAQVAQAVMELPESTEDPRYVAALAVAEPVLQCQAVMDLLDGFDDVTDADALRLLGMAAHAIGDTVRSIDFLERAEALLREQGRLALLSQVLSMQVIDRLELGDWQRAASAAQEGEQLAFDSGQPIWRTGTLVCDALSNALRGEVEQAFAFAAEAELAASRGRLNDLLSCVQRARGTALAASGDPEAAYFELRRAFDPADPSFHGRERFGSLMFLADCAEPAGRVQDAREVASQLERVLAKAPSPLLDVSLRYARAVLANEDDAGHFYTELQAQDLSRWPWVKARSDLAYGAWLGRQGRLAEARDVLRAAETGFDGIGATVWSDRARQQRSALDADYEPNGART
ncbi:MAG TPA: AAA family ATPase [Streptosporangiaceae bacterium]|nr:AAA family ATPase [Streptosporangiaceae bacterium]